MVDWETRVRDFMNQPLLHSLFTAWSRFLSIERGNKFPFYVFPTVKQVGEHENVLLDFVDNLVDIHELERNKDDKSRTFTERFRYVTRNFHRHQNDTVANLMFDTQLTKPQYDKLNSTIAVRYLTYLGTMTALHTAGFTYLCYFFRYRRLTLVP